MNKQTALITGASSGIGAVYADRLAARGYNLILVARRAERLQKLADELAQKYGANVQVCAADLAQENGQAAVAEIIENTSDLTLLVNCAGLGALGFAANVAWADVDGLIKVNVQALTHHSPLAHRRQAFYRRKTRQHRQYRLDYRPNARRRRKRIQRI